MAFSVPVAISIVGDARMVRNVFRPASPSNVAQTYISYVAEVHGLTRLIMRSTIGVDLSEVVIPVIVRDVDSYTITCREDDLMLIAWSDGTSVNKFFFDLKNTTAAITQTTIAQGINPELSSVVAGRVQMFYTRGSIVCRRVSFDSGVTWSIERVINNPSNATFDRYGMSQKPTSTKFNYLADVGFGPKTANGIALPFGSDGNTTLRLDGTNVQTENITEAQPSGTVHYYTMDDGNMSGSTILDSIGAGSINLNLDTGTNVSTTGKVNQARSFNGSTRWRTPGPNDLSYSGDVTIRFWFKINTLGVYHHPVGRAYGAEYAFIIGTAGYIYVYWGASGGNAPPYQGIGLPDGTIQTNTWYHVAYTRDMTSRVARFYLNGELRVQEYVFVTPSASSNYTYFGWNSWTNHFMQGAVDELVFNNVPLTPLQIKLSYEKGLAGNPDNVSGVSSTQVYRSVANTTKMYPSGAFLTPVARNQAGIVAVGATSKMHVDPSSANKILVGGATTLEFWIKLGSSNAENDALFDVIARDPNTDVNGAYTTQEGIWSVGFQNNRRLRFTYFGALSGAGFVAVTTSSVTVTGSGTAFTAEYKTGDYVKFSSSTTIYQIGSITSDTVMSLTAGYALATTSGLTMSKIGQHNLIQKTTPTVYRPNSFNYYGLSLDGTISGTILVLNGYRMKTFWLVNPVNIPVAAPLNWALKYLEAPGTVLDSLRISNVAKSLDTMRNYFKGITL